VKFVSAQSLHQKGIGRVLELVPEGTNLLVAFDCDPLDPYIMPAVIGPAPGGLTYWQAIELLDAISKRARIAAFDLVEFFPPATSPDWARSPRGESSPT
jgi:agmatinase